MFMRLDVSYQIKIHLLIEIKQNFFIKQNKRLKYLRF